MKGVSLKAKSREMAFKAYLESGGNVEITLKTLEKEGLKLSKTTFYNWMEQYNFKERLTKIDEEKQKSGDFQISFEDRMFNSLLDRKESYDTYFENNPNDHQAQYAYAGIIKTLFDIRTKTQAFKTSLFLDFMKDLIIFFSKNDPDAVPIIERNFDAFMAYAKDKYAV